MLKKNSLPAGILIALIFPAISIVAAYWLKTNIYLMNKPALPYFIAIGLNLILLRICFKKDLDKTGRGITLATFVFMVLIFVFKLHHVR
jgi:hypothetical protein